MVVLFAECLVTNEHTSLGTYRPLKHHVRGLYSAEAVRLRCNPAGFRQPKASA